MLLRVERGSPVPISRQIAQQIRAQCLSGALPAGTRLPSVRELARELAVNVNTIFRIYERLAADRLIELRHGDGTFVLPRPATKEATRQLQEQRAQYATEFTALVRRGVLLGLSAADLRRQLNEALKAAEPGAADVSSPLSSEARS